MKTLNPLANAIRMAMLFGSLSAVTVSLPTFAEEAAEDEEEIETIVVTGSRIERDGFETTTPTTITAGEDITNLGYTGLAEALNNIPSFGNPGNSTEGDQGSQGVGQNFVNFYGMGSQRTLTLVNGRRFVSSNPLQGGGAASGLQVDLNMIPVQMIERVETVGVGGAPVYGADAISGTVNIILKDNYEGFDISYSNGISKRSDLQEKKVSMITGANFDGDKGNAILSVDYSTREGAIEADRKHLSEGWQFREPCDSNGPIANGAGNSAFEAADCNFDRVLVAGGHANLVGSGGLVTTAPFALPNFGIGALGDGNFYQFGSNGSLQPYGIGLPTDNAVWSIGGEGIFLPDVTNLYTPLDRVLLNSIVNYDISDNVRTYGEFFYGNTKATEMANQPYYQSGLFGEESGALLMNVNNPFISDATRTQLAGLGVTDDFYLQRSSTDLLPSNNSVDNEGSLWRFVAGFEGEFEFADREFSWDVSYNIGRSDSVSQRASVQTDRFFYALDAVRAADGSIQCRVVDDPSTRPTDPASVFGASTATDSFDNCVPLNLFGSGAPSADALAYISGVVTAKSETEQEVVSATIQGDVVELPAGDLTIAAGLFHRKENASFTPDAAYTGNLTRSGVLADMKGGFAVDEAYVEFFAPAIDDSMAIPYVNELTFEGAFRTMDNSFAGKDEAYSLGMSFSPIEDLSIKYNQTRSVRAPAITELFLPVVEVGSFATDPCDESNTGAGPNPTQRAANCAADGIPTDFQSQAGNASVQGLSGGNQELVNEGADSTATTLVYTPSYVEGLTVGVDYVTIELEDAIEEFTLTQIMEACYDAADFPNAFCGDFTRQANGQLPSIDAFKSGYVNAGIRTFKGMNYKVFYNTELPAFGSISASANIFRPLENKVTTVGTPNDNNGEPGNSELQGNFSLAWNYMDFGVIAQTRYIGDAVLNNNDIRVATDSSLVSRDVLDLKAQWITDLGAWYSYKDMARIQLNVSNVFDELPEAAAVASGTDFVYDNRGRYYRVGLNLKF